MMNKKFYDKAVLASASIMLLLSACSTDEAADQQADTLVMLTATVTEAATRGAIGLQSAQLASGQTFYATFTAGIVNPSGTAVTSATYTADGAGGIRNVSTGQPYFSRTTSSATVRAYHGKSGGSSGAQVTNATTAFSVALNQTADADYMASDLMYAATTVSKTYPISKATLQFSHQMARVAVTVHLGQGISSVTGVRIVNGYRTISIANPETTDEASAHYLGTALSDALSASDNGCLSLYSGSYTDAATPLLCAAVLPPQTIDGSFLQVVTDKGSATYTVGSKALASGCTYNYDVTVSLAAVNATTAITDWTNQDTKHLCNIGYANAATIEGVDLGLSVKWANMNIGATSETDYGLYFMWGDVVGHLDSETLYYGWGNYKWSDNGGSTSFTKYTGSDYTVLQPEDDAATVNWGSSWRMPTPRECAELTATRSNTNYTWEWVENYKDSGHNGWLITYKSKGNTLFLPASELRSGYSFTDSKTYGVIWTSDLFVNNIQNGVYFYYNNSSPTPTFTTAGNLRYLGATIRPVMPN